MKIFFLLEGILFSPRRKYTYSLKEISPEPECKIKCRTSCTERKKKRNRLRLRFNILG